MAKKKQNVKIKKVNVLIVILVIILVALLITIGVLAKNILKKDKKTAEPEVVDKIGNYGYYLTDRSTSYFKELYEELKALVRKDNFDEKEYASLIAKMFVADFYDLDSKASKSDVGGVQFVYDKFQDTFVKFASDSNGIYYYVKSDLYGDRKQTLPKVKSVEVTSVKNTKFTNKKYVDEKAYEVKTKVTYATDLGYPKSVKVVLVHNSKKLEVVEVK